MFCGVAILVTALTSLADCSLGCDVCCLVQGLPGEGDGWGGVHCQAEDDAVQGAQADGVVTVYVIASIECCTGS